MIVNRDVNHDTQNLPKIEVPLTSFLQCHLGIPSRLQAFSGLPALQTAAA